MAKLFVVLAAIVAVCAASSIREKRQTYPVQQVQCGQTNGPQPDPANCGRYYECYNGRAFLKNCVAGLLFNPTNNQCDFPDNVQNPNCQRQTTTDVGCQGGRLFAAHPEYCNAFFNCLNGYLANGCTFCAAGQYFDEVSGFCAPSSNPSSVCGNKRFIQPVNQEVSRLENSCYPRPLKAGFQPLLQKIRGQGPFVTSGPYNTFRPFGTTFRPFVQGG